MLLRDRVGLASHTAQRMRAYSVCLAICTFDHLQPYISQCVCFVFNIRSTTNIYNKLMKWKRIKWRWKKVHQHHLFRAKESSIAVLPTNFFSFHFCRPQKPQRKLASAVIFFYCIKSLLMDFCVLGILLAFDNVFVFVRWWFVSICMDAVFFMCASGVCVQLLVRQHHTDGMMLQRLNMR